MIHTNGEKLWKLISMEKKMAKNEALYLRPSNFIYCFYLTENRKSLFFNGGVGIAALLPEKFTYLTFYSPANMQKSFIIK